MENNMYDFLLAKYPFLKCYDPYFEDDNECYNVLEDIPRGWVKAFGKLMCEDIMEILKKKNMVDKYKVYQAKEKFGELRWYDNSGDPEIGALIAKYSYISSFTCVDCGKLNASVLYQGYIYPSCYECYHKRHKGISKEEFNNLSKGRDFTPTFKIKEYTKDKVNIIEYDCSDILRKIELS